MKKKHDETSWKSIIDDIPPSDIPILIYVYGKVLPAKHAYAKFSLVGIKHYFTLFGEEGKYISEVTHWREMPDGPEEPKIKEFVPD